ncbi:PRC-barrel domain-containing protein [Microbacterium pumilum]|uniref:PRC-barrel domain-containing protein n=1 Tax=Microbacterium pumilum TaxID=344165 RepID=A0ABN2RSV1_9MICO
MINIQNSASLIGADVTDVDGKNIGSVGQIFVNPTTGTPTWATVKSGLFGTSQSFVPLERADEVGGDLHLPFTKDAVRDSPRTATDGELSEDDADKLLVYYRGPATVSPVGY